jgi:hypothetical protein
MFKDIKGGPVPIAKPEIHIANRFAALFLKPALLVLYLSRYIPGF